jgi:hypothetical protein
MIGQTQDLPYDLDNRVYDEDVYTVTLEANGNPERAFPIINLKGEFISFKFDDLSGRERKLYYKFIHCNRDWTVSSLRDVDFISGFNDEPIRNINYSAITKVQYINYALTFPNPYTSFKVSGNYVLLIYEDSEDNPVITRKFIVSENIVSTKLNQVYASDVENIIRKQEYTLDVTTKGLNMRNPLKEFSISMFRNDDWSTELISFPTITLTDLLRFNRLGTFQFWGLSEFRHFDTRTLLSVGRNVDKVIREKDRTDVYLTLDQSKREAHHSSYYDFNGRFLVDNADAVGRTIFQSNDAKSLGQHLKSLLYGTVDNGTASLYADRDIRSDYVNVHFSYEEPFEIPNGHSIYVVGNFNNWTPDEKYLMVYDEKKNIYRNTILLKQGYYEYCYVIADEDGKIKHNILESSWAETENDYHIVGYYRGISDIYDRVVTGITANTTIFLNNYLRN